jgi:hypothetical protein
LTISGEIRTEVMRRAGLRCDYCLLHEDHAAFRHEVDHIIRKQHAGATTANNLAYACMVCNRYKGSNVASVSSSGDLVPLFNPRQHRWSDHLGLDGAVIEPLDLIGAVTARVLRLNTAERVVRRSLLQQLRRYPKS